MMDPLRRSGRATMNLIVGLACLAAPARAQSMADGPDGLKVRRGYQVSVAVDRLPEARFMEFDQRATLYVSRPQTGDVVALMDADGDGTYEKQATFVSGLSLVHGLCFADGWLWMAQSTAISRARDNDGDGKADERVNVVGGLPGDSGHWWRSLLVTADGFYTSVGDSGNITDETRSDRQKIWKFSLDGKSKALVCSGIRNTEKLRFRPGTQELWGVDHGSDNFGGPLGERPPRRQPVTDFNPPCEFNHYRQDHFYGHPFIVGNRLPRYEFMKRADILDLAERTTPPEWCFGAHWAPNGFCFIDPATAGKVGGFPADHGGDALVAFHGSWNRREPSGYCVARVHFDDGHPYGLTVIVDGSKGAPNDPAARPVDCVQAPDGSVLWSDDFRGRIYRIRYAGADAPGR